MPTYYETGDYPSQTKSNGKPRRSNRGSTLEVYLREVDERGLLTREEEIRYAERARNGDIEAIEKLVEGNLRFVVKIAKEYQGRGMRLDDLIAEGNKGLMSALRKYDETKGYKFITYAVWWIRQSILQALANESRMVRIPVNNVKRLNKIQRTANELRQEYGREPTAEEIAEKAKLRSSYVRDLLCASKVPVSLDELSLEGTPLREMIEDEKQETPENEMMEQDMREQVRRLLSSLSPREAQVLTYFFGIDRDERMTLEGIGKEFRITDERESVRKIKTKDKI